ncbi:MAG: 3-deoxy-7-phosphoheptulonate synthase [Microthrixaceae bacterium]
MKWFGRVVGTPLASRLMLVVTNELDRFRRDTDALARRDSRFLRAAVRGDGVTHEHLESALALILALTGMSMSEEGRRTLKVIELGGGDDRAEAETVGGTAARANLLRALVASGFSSFDRSDTWLDGEQLPAEVASRWATVRENLGRDLAFIEACGVDPDVYTQIQRASLYFSGRVDAGVAHTDGRALLEAHLLVARADLLAADTEAVRLLARMDNPVLVQVGATDDGATLLELLETVDRLRSPGRVMVSLAAGADVASLAPLIETVAAGRPATAWVGNPVPELAGADASPPAASQVVARTSALSDAVEAVGSHLGGFDLEIHATQMAAAPVVLAALGADR